MIGCRALRWLARLLLVAAALFVSAEIAARVYLHVKGYPASRYIQVNHALRQARAASRDGFDTEYPYLPFRPAPGANPNLAANGLGFLGEGARWEPPERTLRVLCTGGSMVYYDAFPTVLEDCLDSLLAGEDTGYDSCQLLVSSGPTWSSMECLVYYAVRGVYTRPHVVIVYVAVNDVYAMFVPDSIEVQPDYSHYRISMMPLPPVPWDLIPGWADSSRAVALSRYALDRIMYPAYQKSPPPRLGLMYRFYPEYSIDTTFATYRSNLEAMAAIAVSRGSSIFFVSELHDSTRSSSPAMAHAVEALNDIAEAVARRHEAGGLVHFVDAASTIPADSSTLSDKSHLTEEGSELIGRLVASEVCAGLRHHAEEP
ncbi:SGNH/GDSL hydrolase family protein [Candidatus Fermentibacterales bacterium]|nr:SGNH/GDSL hydrolase family protein [Candidatus Fermentibacterales bacterium]